MRVLPSLRCCPAAHKSWSWWCSSLVLTATPLQTVGAGVSFLCVRDSPRSSNDSTDEVLARVKQLESYKVRYPKLQLYLSSVVMRIPSYNEDEEEPDYWAQWGRDLYLFSYLMDEYDVTGNVTCYDQAVALQRVIPVDVMQQFTWRRARNFNVTSRVLTDMAGSPGLFKQLYITLDDNALYGFNIAESLRLKAQVGGSADQSIHPRVCQWVMVCVCVCV